jgi:glyoxylase-like metal-dependent hydrolase (beta-lactamase superfamily II)/rhodanese-related sulfurtransferase
MVARILLSISVQEACAVEIQHFFEPRTATLSYLVYDRPGGVGIVIDPVLDFDPASGCTHTTSADVVCRFAEARGLALPYALDTHAHADHLSGIQIFAERFGSKTGIGAQIREVQRGFAEIYDLGPEFPTDGRQFDVLLEDGEPLEVGPFSVVPLHTPGHTPACMSYQIADALFVGDTLFQPDYGTARCDFPGGSAETLYDSIQRLYRLPEETRLFTCHDYQPNGRELRFESRLHEQKQQNVQLDAKTSRETYTRFRRERDATLDVPELILPSIQVNIDAGRLPAPRANGRSYLQLPLNTFGAGAATARFAEIDVRAAAARLAEYRVVDVREPEEFTGPLGHVAGSELLPLAGVAEQASALRGRPLLLVCRSGRRSGQVCETLIALGIQDVTNLAGGMIAWNDAGLPVEGRASA